MYRSMREPLAIDMVDYTLRGMKKMKIYGD